MAAPPKPLKICINQEKVKALSQTKYQSSLSENTRASFNRVFETLVDEAEDPLIGMVAYALYKRAKREWAIATKSGEDRALSSEEEAQFVRLQTENQLNLYRNEAIQLLYHWSNEFMKGDIAEKKREILEGHVAFKLEEFTGAIKKETGWVKAIFSNVGGSAIVVILLGLLYLTLGAPNLQGVLTNLFADPSS